MKENEERKRLKQQEEERVVLEEQRRKAAQEEQQRRAAQEEKQRRAALQEQQRRAAFEEQQRRAAQEEQQRRATEEEQQRRAAQEEQQRRAVKEEQQMRAAEEEQQRRAAQEEQQRRAVKEEQQKRAAQEEQQRRAVKEEQQKRAALQEQQKRAALQEQQRQAKQIEEKLLAEIEEEKKRALRKPASSSQDYAAHLPQHRPYSRRSIVLDEDDSRSVISNMSEDVESFATSAADLADLRGLFDYDRPERRSCANLQQTPLLELRNHLRKFPVLLPPPPLSHPAPVTQYHVETSYPQSYPLTQRKVLQDLGSGQYFVVDVPVQVKTKTFFDPETGKYVQLNVRESGQSTSRPQSRQKYPQPQLQSQVQVKPQQQPLSQAPPAGKPLVLYQGYHGYSQGYQPAAINSVPPHSSSAPVTLYQDQDQPVRESHSHGYPAPEMRQNSEGQRYSPEKTPYMDTVNDTEKTYNTVYNTHGSYEAFPECDTNSQLAGSSGCENDNSAHPRYQPRDIITMSDLEDFMELSDW
ncbi:transcription factor SPT20 homolog [Seriola lalandi dorsalis]|uniref:transcription factor SPT20 homolog n=1 Tax=Seriola lalandi dorsalis TaxID=1841481 RepID=UPI000C6F74C4|nr:transcription factor SPT20 homolog [Seriola lalandi dorsalis]